MPRPRGARSGRRLSPSRTARPPPLKAFARMRRSVTAHRASDLKGPVVERERVEPRLVLRAAHLHAPQPALDVEVRRRVEPELDDPVREVRLLRVVAHDGALHGLL